MNCIKGLFVLCMIMVSALTLKAQIKTEESEGNVSYTTSQSVYIKFPSTKGILAGDTLFLNRNSSMIPALIVKNFSSTSIVATTLGDISIHVNDKVIARRKIEIRETPKEEVNIKDNKTEIPDTTVISEKSNQKTKISARKQRIFGHAAISNSFFFSNTPAPYSYVNNFAFSFNINNMGNSKFSLLSHILFRQEKGEWENVKKNVYNGLKIYNLALKYDINKSLYLLVGRRINPNISNIGAIDGLQAEKSFRGLFIGGFAGFRPDYQDYGFNFNLLQFGGYLGYNMQTTKRNMHNSLAFVEQMNNMNTDRRFLYFQHNSSLLKNVNLFLSIEMDLYEVASGQKQNTFDLTNLYASLRWRPFKKLTLSGTYDARNNVIYYETYKDYLSTLIEKETRQGLGFFANYTLAKNLYAGVKVGYRFQKGDLRPTKNAYMFITYSNIGRSQIAATLSSTILETNYLQGNVINLRLSRPFISGRMNLGCGYSFVNYKILNGESNFRQHIAELNFSVEVIKRFSIVLNAEADFEKNNQFYRAYIQLRKRF